MQYLGGKARIAKKLLPILQVLRGDRLWVEPFVGGANMFHLVPGPKVGADAHEYVIALLTAVRDGWTPPTEITEDQYRDMKARPTAYPPHLVGFAGFCCSFAGKWFGSYARDRAGQKYALCGHNTLRKQALGLRGSVLLNCSYDEVPLIAPSFIYCDPPYAGTARYRDAFDSERFWDWCRARRAEGHVVAVSEYNAPADFLCVWEHQSYTTLSSGHTGAKTRIERLFC